MADLISRKATMDAFRAYMVEHFDKDKCAKVENCEVCEKKCLWHEVVASVPAVDAVEVVRCKDCKYQGKAIRVFAEENPIEVNTCMFKHISYNRETDFCSYGERRESDGDTDARCTLP